MTDKKRCTYCNKKLKMIHYNCKCGGEFCSKHRYTHTHECPLVKEKKEESKKMIEKLNPKTESSTLIKIN